MSRNPFNSLFSWQSVNLTHCWRINREQKAVWRNCWQLTSTTVKPWNPHQFQDVQQTTEEGGGWLCSGRGKILSVLIWYTILRTHTHTVHTHTDNIYTPADHHSPDTSTWALFTPCSQEILINHSNTSSPDQYFSHVRCWNHPVQQQAEMSRGHWGLACSWWIISHLVPLKVTNNGLS